MDDTSSSATSDRTAGTTRSVPVRILFAAIVLSALAGGLAGYAAGASGGDGEPTNVAAGSGADGDDAALDTSGESGDSGASRSAAGAADIAIAPERRLALERVFVRTAAGGIAVRLHRADYPDQEVGCVSVAPSAPGDEVTTLERPVEDAGADATTDEGPAADPVPAPLPPDGGGGAEPWCPPPECTPTGDLQIGLSNEGAVGMGGVGVFPLGGQAASVAGVGSFGDAEGDPGWWVAVQAADGVATVRVTFDGGAVDEMAPVGGWAVLAAPGAEPLAVPSGTFQALDPSGAVVVEGDLTPADPYGSPACQPPPPPPPPLPEPTGPPPEDEPAARAAVEETFDTAFDGDLTVEERRGVMDGADRIVDQLDAASEAFPAQAEASETEVDEIRFVDADEAAVRFSVDLGSTTWGPVVGRALLVDGEWKVAQATMCELLAYAGYPCEG